MECYLMNKEYGYLVTAEQLIADCEECGYDDVIDPSSVEYMNFSIHYRPMN